MKPFCNFIVVVTQIYVYMDEITENYTHTKERKEKLLKFEYRL